MDCNESDLIMNKKCETTMLKINEKTALNDEQPENMNLPIEDNFLGEHFLISDVKEDAENLQQITTKQVKTLTNFDVEAGEVAPAVAVEETTTGAAINENQTTLLDEMVTNTKEIEIEMMETSEAEVAIETPAIASEQPTTGTAQNENPVALLDEVVTNEIEMEIEMKDLNNMDNINKNVIKTTELGSNSLPIEDEASPTIEKVAKSQFSKRKKFTIIDSESEESDNEATPIMGTQSSDHKNSSDEENNKSTISTNKSKNFRLIDSDSEPEEKRKVDDVENTTNLTSKSKFSALIDSDSDSGSQSEESETEISHGPVHAASDEEKYEDENSTEATDTQISTKNKQEKTVRAAAKKALDGMQAIQSEQQRLHREAHISIPYHKPKRHTLQEFLKRHTIIKPSLKGDGSPAAAVVQSKKLKMTPEELAEYAKLLEERAKEATEFFKSESDDDEVEVEEKLTLNERNLELLNNETEQSLENRQTAETNNSSGICFKTTVEEWMKLAPEKENSANILNQTGTESTQDIEPIKQQQDTLTKETTSEITAVTAGFDDSTDFERALKIDTEDIPSTSNDYNQRQTVIENNLSTPDVLPYSEEVQLSSQPIVTEVLELPRLNMKDLNMNTDGGVQEIISIPISTPTPTPTPILTPAHKSEHLKRLLGEEVLHESPSLHGDANMLIDLETGDLIPKKASGVDNLLQRFLSMHKPKKVKEAETVSILSTENGKLEMSEVQIHKNDEKEMMMKEQKPGAAFIKYKESLKSLINQKRHEKLQKKRDEVEEYNMCLDLDEDEEDYEEYEPGAKHKEKISLKNIVVDEDENAFEVDDDDEEEGDEIMKDGEEPDDAENVEEGEDIKETAKKMDVNDDENDDNDVDDDDGDVDDSDDSDEESDDKGSDTCVTADAKRKSRIIKAFQDDSDNEAEILPPASSTAALFDKKVEEKSLSDAENELLGLCSGGFTQTLNPTATQSIKENNKAESQQMPFISQIPITQRNVNKDETEELLQLCSGTFDKISGSTDQDICTTDAMQTQLSLEDQSKLQMALKSNKILSSDEEVGEEIKNPGNRKKKLTKRRKKKNVKLGFSDDEESAEEYCENESEVDGDDYEAIEEEPEDQPETFIDYDSEENEIVVQMTKKDCAKQAQNFLQKEAELSESEWGSADEDEKNLDNYDIELGDEDVFDRYKLQTELGQIHARKVLDEDIREVRKLQEMFFEDEENDGVGRQRQFRWKNAENGFSLDDTNRVDIGEGEPGESGDEENEQMWRKIRFEREQLLKEQGLTNSQDLTTTVAQSMLEASILTTKKSLTPGGAKKFNIITTKKTTTTVDIKKNSPFLITKSLADSVNKKSRGSFLVRDKATLVKIASITKGSGSVNNFEDTDGMEPVRRVKTKTTNNFVFSILTEEEHENIKRKADDLMNSSSENGVNYMKKPKLAPKREKCFIDQLMH